MRAKSPVQSICKVALALSLCIVLSVPIWGIITDGGFYCPRRWTPLERAVRLHRRGRPGALESAQKCVNELLPQAERIQVELEGSNTPLPPRIINYEAIAASHEDPHGKDHAEFVKEFKDFVDGGANEILARGPLNDAALCQWIEAESQARLGNIVEARLGYLKMQRFSCGLVLVPRRGSKPSDFWSPFHEASIHLTKRSGEPPISTYPAPGVITYPYINSLYYSHPDVSFPHMTAAITNPSYGQRVGRHLAVVGTVAVIPDSVYLEVLFPGEKIRRKVTIGETTMMIIYNNSFELMELDQSLRSRLLDENISVGIPQEIYLYVLAQGDSSNDSGYAVTEATVHGKLWNANLALRTLREVSVDQVEIIVAASYRELPSQIDSLPSDIWPVAWTRVTTSD